MPIEAATTMESSEERERSLTPPPPQQEVKRHKVEDNEDSARKAQPENLKKQLIEDNRGCEIGDTQLQNNHTTRAGEDEIHGQAQGPGNSVASANHGETLKPPESNQQKAVSPLESCKHKTEEEEKEGEDGRGEEAFKKVDQAFYYIWMTFYEWGKNIYASINRNSGDETAIDYLRSLIICVNYMKLILHELLNKLSEERHKEEFEEELEKELEKMVNCLNNSGARTKEGVGKDITVEELRRFCVELFLNDRHPVLHQRFDEIEKMADDLTELQQNLDNK